MKKHHFFCVLVLVLMLALPASAMISEGNITEIPTKEPTIEPTVVVTPEPVKDIANGIIEFPTIESGKLILKYHNLKSVSGIIVTNADTGELLDVIVTGDIVSINSTVPLRIIDNDIMWIIRSSLW